MMSAKKKEMKGQRKTGSLLWWGFKQLLRKVSLRWCTRKDLRRCGKPPWGERGDTSGAEVRGGSGLFLESPCMRGAERKRERPVGSESGKSGGKRLVTRCKLSRVKRLLWLWVRWQLLKGLSRESHYLNYIVASSISLLAQEWLSWSEGTNKKAPAFIQVTGDGRAWEMVSFRNNISSSFLDSSSNSISFQ